MISGQAFLKQLLARRKVPHALCFVGEKEEIEKKAYEFVGDLLDQESGALQKEKALKKEHPDVHLFVPEGKTGMHAIETIRHLCQEESLHSHGGSYKVFILHDAERMLPTSSNALLKTLEEPHKKTLFILLTESFNKLLPTIASRCQTLFFSQQLPSRSLTLFQKQFLSILATHDLSSLEGLCASIEEEKKVWEKEIKASSSDDSALQKESLEKEREGWVALKYQEVAFSLFENILEWYRDVYALRLGAKEVLFHPEYQEALQKTPFVPYSKVEKAVKTARLAIERSTKLHPCLEYLMLKLGSA